MKLSKKLIWAVMACIAMPPVLAATPTPVQEELAKLIATDGYEWDRFGNDVAVDGDTALVGAYYWEDQIPLSNRGAAYVFTRDSGGGWSQQAQLLPSDYMMDDQFGYSVALDGDTAVIGAWNEDSEGFINNGAAYVFTRDATGNWTQQAKLLASDKAAYDLFGYSVAVDGDTAVIGAAYESSGEYFSNGAAYVFVRDTYGNWSQQAKLLADDMASSDRFGAAVALDGDTAVVGARWEGTAPYSANGAAYVFTRDAGGSWSQQVKLLASDMRSGYYFGFSVDVDGGSVAVGAYAESSFDTNVGAAYIYSRDSSGNWIEKKLVASDRAAYDGFGYAVALENDVAVIGAPGADIESTMNSGAAYVFLRNGVGEWVEHAKLVASDRTSEDRISAADLGTIDIGGGTVIIGAPYEDNGNGTDAGSAYIFTIAATDGPPVISNVSAGDVAFPADVTLTASATDAETTIASAEYTLNGGDSWMAMDPGDDTFDSATEALTATLSGLSVGNYDVCVRATDDQGNASEITRDVDKGDCTSFDVTAADLGITFLGELLNMDGDATLLDAVVSGPAGCTSGAQVDFSVLREGENGSEYWEDLGYGMSDVQGLANLELSLAPGVYHIKVVVGDQYLDGEEDADPECNGAEDTGITVVADARASSTGGGWYKIDGLTPPRVNFGYTAQTKYNKKLDEYTTSGNLLWMHQDNYRLKGTINAGGKLPEEACPAGFATCAAFAGEGTLYQHNPDYDPDCVDQYSCEPEWINAIPNNPFIFFVHDGGLVEECVNKKKCKQIELTDQFGIEIAIENVSGESDPVYLSGGSLVVR